MPTITLSARVFSKDQFKIVDKLVRSMMKDLKVEIETQLTSQKWIKATFSGEDEAVTLRYLEDRIGRCPVSIENVRRLSTVHGYIASSDDRELRVDIGVWSPRIYHAVIPLRYLQAQLVDGRKTALAKIAELFSLTKNMPLNIKIHDGQNVEGNFKAMLSEKQLSLFKEWLRSFLDRLVIIGASLNEVENGVRRARCVRDVLNIEPLGFFEHAVVCKLGTDAVGLIPKLGRRIRKARFSVFNPERIRDFLGDYVMID
jgi:hypothetical protein